MCSYRDKKGIPLSVVITEAANTHTYDVKAAAIETLDGIVTRRPTKNNKKETENLCLDIKDMTLMR